MQTPRKKGVSPLLCVIAGILAVLLIIVCFAVASYRTEEKIAGGKVDRLSCETLPPDEKGEATDTIKEITEPEDPLDRIGGVVYYCTGEEPYKSASYGTDSLELFSCGPTTMAMIVSTLTDTVIDPIEMCNWSVDHGYWCPGGGTYTAFLRAAAEEFGVPVQQAYWSVDTIRAALDEGKLIMFTVGPGDFTLGAHYLLLRGMTEDGDLLICDSYRRDHSERVWDYYQIFNQLQNGTIWIYG